MQKIKLRTEESGKKLSAAYALPKWSETAEEEKKKIPFIYEHLFYKYFVHRSVGQAKKCKKASLLMEVIILVKG